MIRHEDGLTVFNPPEDARQIQRAVVGRDAFGKYILVAIGFGQFLGGRSSIATRRFLLAASSAVRTLLFGFRRLLLIQTLRRMLSATLSGFLFEPLILRPQLVDRLLLITNGLIQISNRLSQFTNQINKLIDAQLCLVTAP